nr:upstream transcription factor 1 [Hymenolepis microstoma]
MDNISNNELAPAASQSHLAGASYINGRDFLTHFANLSSHERPRSKSPNIPSSTNNTPSKTNSADIYSAILNSQQQQQSQQPIAMDETLAASSSFSSPIRHLSEPSNAPNRRSPIVDEPMEHTPRSCRTSPSVPMKSFQQFQQQRSTSPPRSLDSSPNHNSNNNSNSMEPQSSTASSTASVFSLTQSSLQELMRKSGNSIPAEEIKKANNSSQLYLLVPSNYPVLVAVGNERKKASAAAAAAASAVNEPTTRSLLERFQFNSSTTPTPPAPPQQPSPTVVQPGQLDGQRQMSAGANASLPRAPRKNSTNIPPMILQSLKGVVPPINFREILESGGAAGNGNTGGSANLSSFTLSYGAGDLPSSGAGDHPSLPGDRKKSLTVPSDAASSFLEEFRAAAAAAAEVKIKPPSSSGAVSTTGPSGPDSGLCPSDGLLGTDSNGNLFFTSANESPPTRNYMGRMGGGAVGANQSNVSGGDSKDIRRRVSHNEVERRRRDRINTWIAELYKLLPPEQQAKSQYQSKGVVLKRVCEYFQNYDATLKSLREENSIFKQEIYRLTRENQLLRSSLNAAHFQQQPSSGPSGTPSVAVGVTTECDDSKTPSPSKRTHFVTSNE